jgi:hypothetical protein
MILVSLSCRLLSNNPFHPYHLPEPFQKAGGIAAVHLHISIELSA